MPKSAAMADSPNLHHQGPFGRSILQIDLCEWLPNFYSPYR
jgi:hypothetical protein